MTGDEFFSQVAGSVAGFLVLIGLIALVFAMMREIGRSD